jgi:hypothetical protein
MTADVWQGPSPPLESSDRLEDTFRSSPMLILRSNAAWVSLAPSVVGRSSLEEMRHYVHTRKATSPLSRHSRAQTLLDWISNDFSIVEPI